MYPDPFLFMQVMLVEMVRVFQFQCNRNQIRLEQFQVLLQFARATLQKCIQLLLLMEQLLILGQSPEVRNLLVLQPEHL